MANVRIKDLTTTAATTASDDFFGVDGATNGTRKLNAFSPTFGGNLTVSGTGTHTFGTTNTVTIAAGKISTTGKVGIGTTAHPNLQLTVVQPTANAAALWTESVNTLGQSQGVIINAGTNASDFGLVVRNAAQTDMFKVDGASNATLAGNLTVSGTGNSSVAGTLLVATTTNSSNGKLQLADHSNSAGGIGFGTDTAIFRTSNGRIAIDALSASTVFLELNLAGGKKGEIAADASNVYIGSAVGGLNTIIRSGAGTTALTLDSSQNATFAGKATATRLIANSQWVAASAGTGALSATANAGVQLTGTGAVNDITLVNKNGDNVMVVPTGTTNATFAGAIAIGNTVNTVSPTSPNRTITMVIGGTTYYIHAKTTND